MNDLVDIAGIGELKDGTMKAITVRGYEILLTRVENRYYAINNTCPHLHGRLSEGTLEGYTVTCPRHGSQFDIRTGENIRWLKGSGLVANIAKLVKPPQSIRSYRTEVKGNRIFIEV